MNNFSEILEDIHSSPKAIRVLPSDNDVKERIVEQYDIRFFPLMTLWLQRIFWAVCLYI